MNTSGDMRPLRTHLQTGTRGVHERLDRYVGGLDLLSPGGYSRFLACQLNARAAIEEWADRHCPGLLRPPSTAWLLRHDLEQLAQTSPDANQAEWATGPAALPAFVLPADCDPLGLAWAIAGSHIGNRTVHAQLRRGLGEAHEAVLPCRFLQDRRMIGFWHRLLPRLQDAVSRAGAEPALAAARAVFARFEQAFDGIPHLQAA